jgi:hypothetical protein
VIVARRYQESRLSVLGRVTDAHNLKPGESHGHGRSRKGICALAVGLGAA